MRIDPAKSTSASASRASPRRTFLRAVSGSIRSRDDERIYGHRDEEERQIGEREGEESARVGGRVLPAQHEGEADESAAEQERGAEVDPPEGAPEDRQQRDRDEDERVADDRTGGLVLSL